MPSTDVELCLAALFTDADCRRAFLAEPASVLGSFDLSAEERASLADLDRAGLVLAGNSFSAKRAKYKRWMHTLAKTIPEYEDLVDAGQLDDARALALRRASRRSRQSGTPPGLQQRLDFIPWDAESHHNREHMLRETEGIEPVSAVWDTLEAAVLRHHHLLRCYAVATNAAPKTAAHREHPRPGAYLTYVVLGDGGSALPPDALVLLDERQHEICRIPLKAGRTVVFGADIQHRIACAEPSPDKPRLLLAFKTLATID